MANVYGPAQPCSATKPVLNRQTSQPGTPWLQQLLPRRGLTRLIYRLTRIRTRWIKNLTIRLFARAYRVDVSDTSENVPHGYATFNDFFTRALLPGARPLAGDPEVWCSPCDGKLSAFGPLDDGMLVQAKGLHYSRDALLAGASGPGVLANACFATIYLAPYNYHRVHCPFDGELVSEHQVGHDLYSVSPDTVANIKNLFIENERRVLLFRNRNRHFAVILVGALNVGSITTVSGGEFKAGKTKGTPQNSNELTPSKREYSRGDLLGWFNMGSTVVLVADQELLSLSDTLRPDDIVRMGSALGRRPGV